VTTSADGQTFYDAIGGYPTIAKIVHRFYDGVATDEVLRPLYPCDDRVSDDAVLVRLYPEAPDLSGARHRLTLFLVQYWGGPTTYSDQRGHPRLRMRHAPFKVTPKAKEHWLTHFRAGLDEANLPPELDAQFWDYVTHAAQFMVNTFEQD
jgi:hemoglobin